MHLTGHSSTQMPQPLHLWYSISGRSSFHWIAVSGQNNQQDLHPVHLSRSIMGVKTLHDETSLRTP